MKKVLVIGSGGREHALAWKFSQSAQVEKVYAAPGNPGMEEIAECVKIDVLDQEKLLQFAKTERIDLTVVGPEVPLMEGITDRFRQENLNIYGPSAAAARLEGSKVFAKNFFKKYHIPTADYQTFSDMAQAMEYARACIKRSGKVVVKADGLAAGKGVMIAESLQDAEKAVREIMEDKQFGEAGRQVVVEEYLDGEELSFFAISDGENFIPFLTAQDHKRVFDHDEGPNTGGMGAYTNPPIYNETLKERIIHEVIQPTLEGMKKEGCPYQGTLYAGLMITPEGPKILEYNVRFGDPETQVLMPMLKSDAYELFEAASTGRLKDFPIEVYEEGCVCVVLASKGYPGKYETGKEITGLDQLEASTMVFHAGTKREKNTLVTAGGRVLSVVCRGKDTREAVEKVYQEIKKIHFDGMHYRTDIAHRAL